MNVTTSQKIWDGKDEGSNCGMAVLVLSGPGQKDRGNRDQVNRMMRAMTSANSEVASDSAKPRNAGVRRRSSIDGLRATAFMYWAQTWPTPIPPPITPIAARPAPIIFAETTSIVVFLS